MKRDVNWSRQARKELRRLDKRGQQRIVAAVNRFADEGQGDVRRLQGVPGEVYRLRVGDWRVIFRDEDKLTILVLRVRPRGDAYKS